MTVLLSKDHSILEKGLMEFRPFGTDERGNKIRDLSGVARAALVEYLERRISQTHGAHAGADALQELCRLLNARIQDPAYHVTPAFLKNTWNSYSSEFGAYVYEFCDQLSGDPQFAFLSGKEMIPPIIQVLGRPFDVSRIYAMYPHFAGKYGAVQCRVVTITPTSAVLAMKFTNRTREQYGPYLRRCAYHRCQSAKGILTMVPEQVHHHPAATVRDLTCIANGDEWCEWAITWTTERRAGVLPGMRKWLIHRKVGNGREQQSGTCVGPNPRPAAISSQAQGVRRASEAQQLEFDHRWDGELLSKEHYILERPFMEFPPFGVDERGSTIRDISGLVIRANVEHLEEHVTRTQGTGAGTRAIEELCRLLNARIRDSAFHVTPAFLKHAWNSYSYEFTSYLREFCEQLSGDPQFHRKVGMERHLSALIAILGRPFSLSKIFAMAPHFVQKYAKDSLVFRPPAVTDRSALFAFKFTERTYLQFGPYRKRCAQMVCEAHKGTAIAVPAKVHGLAPAEVRDRTCIVNGDEWCEWEITWNVPEQGRLPQGLLQTFTDRLRVYSWALLSGAAMFAFTLVVMPSGSLRHALSAGAVSAGIGLLSGRQFQRKAGAREAVVQEQVAYLEARHEELREAYLEREKTQVELRRKVNQLTTLHRAGLLFGSTLDRNALIQSVLKTIIRDLHYDRVMVSLFDRARGALHDTRLLGVPEEIAASARTRLIQVRDPNTVEGRVLLRGEPVLITDIAAVWDQLHPLNQELARLTQTKALVSVPLKVKDEVLGVLTAHRANKHSLTEDDLEVVATLAGQVAIALDNAEAYRQIEDMNAGLEEKVHERTAQLEAANEQLKELNQLKSSFVSMVSHELRTPMTSVRTYVENMLDGITGAVNDKQTQYLRRIKFNIDRLTRMINDLLDLSRIEAGRTELRLEPLPIVEWVNELVEGLRSLAASKSVTLESHAPHAMTTMQADRDKLAQILTNLIGNAIKFTPSGGRVAVTTEFLEDDGMIRFCVSDTGCGIAPEELSNVFEKFFRGETTTSETRGAGLGLAIVKSLVELHGGRVWVDSIVGSGSSFFFTLPLSRAREFLPKGG